MERFQHFETTTTDTILRRAEQIVAEVMPNQIDQMLTFSNACIMGTSNLMDYRLKLPKYSLLSPTLRAEGSRTRPQAQDWYYVYGHLSEFSTEISITDESRGVEGNDLQIRSTIEAQAAGFAWEKENEMRDAIIAGAGATDPASGPWDDPATDIARDLAEVIGDIFANSFMMESDIRNIQIFFPAKLWTFLAKPLEIGQIQQSVRAWAQQNFQINFWPTRALTTDAAIVLKGPRTVRHLSYSGAGMRTVEYERRAGVGDLFIYKQAYNTKVLPDTENGTTNQKIRILSGVLSS
jgi:hypothetical protein